MFRSMLVAVVAVSVVGCTAQTLTATPDDISIKYNRNFTDYMAVLSEANQHCSQYGKVASLADRELRLLSLQLRTFGRANVPTGTKRRRP